jgi:dolichyl-phosphate-mannose-protein mannosyltransferase
MFKDLKDRFLGIHKINSSIVFLVCSAFLLRLVLSFFGTVHLDQGSFIAWSNMLVRDGFKNFYNSWSDYLPGYLYFLWGLGKINLLGFLPEPLLFKLPAILADLITGCLIYKILKKSKGEKWALIGSAVYLFNPAVLGNSAVWGQVDSLTALASILSIYLLPFNYLLSAFSLAAGTLIKPQTAFIFPVIVFLMLKEKWRVQKITIYSLAGLFVFALGFVPFWNHGPFLAFIYERLNVSANQYPYTSINAFNFWGLPGFWKPDNLYFQIGGYALVLVSAVFLFFKQRRTKSPEYSLMAFVFGASFIFFTRIHERHLLPVFAPLAIAAIENPILLIPYFGFSLTYIANLYYSYIYIVDNFRAAFSDFTVKLFELANIGFVGIIFYALARNLSWNWSKIMSFKSKLVNGWSSHKVKSFTLPKLNLSKKKSRYILAGILTFAFITRVFDLGSPTTMYFDEVYHAFTAKVIMSKDVAKAWEWWDTPPEGFAYEWTHPPLAKLGMVLGIFVFGQNSFGWRIPGALLGVGSVLLVYLLAKQIFDDEAIGLLSAGVFSLDGLPLVMSRIGMNDSYILFFALLSIYLYLKDKNFLSALAFGLSLASKWSAIWAIPIFAVIFLSQKKKISLSYLWFFTIPIIIYLASYFDMFLTGHNLSTWWGMQEQMWWYHTGLKATHPYQSSWWTWPLLIRPIYLYTSEEVGGMVSRIYAFGNPAVFWFGFVSIVMSLIYAYLERNKKLALIVFSYFIFFVPWALSPRIMFLYHYLPSIPFMCVAAGYILRRNSKLIVPFFVFAIGLFIYFYPHYAGLRVPIWLDQSYYWVSSWR